MKTILDVAGFLFLLIAAFQFVATLRAYGSLPKRAVAIAIRTTLKSSKIFLLLAAIISLMSATLQPLMPSWIPPFPFLLQVGVAFIGINAACLPPTILYLATSKPEGVSLGSDLVFTVAPLKLTHLLDLFYSDAPLAERNSIEESEYRVTTNWQKTVTDLCEIVPLIIVDARIITPAIISEIDYILNSGLEKRTFFVANQFGKVPALSFVSRLRQRDLQISTLQISTPAELIFALRRVGFNTLVFGQQALAQAVRKKLQARGALLTE